MQQTKREKIVVSDKMFILYKLDTQYYYYINIIFCSVELQ